MRKTDKDGVCATSECDAFCAGVFRSGLVSPARRTCFFETDEATNTFESSIFGAQIVLVDGLSPSVPDMLQVMLFSSTSSEAYDFIATETGNSTKRFVSVDGLWYVDLPASYTPTANVDEAIITVFGPATSEPQAIRVVETGSETDVLLTCQYIESEDTDYPEPSDTTFHYVEVTRWPGVCGDTRTVTGVSGDEFSDVQALFSPAKKYKTQDIMIIPEGYAKPAPSEESAFETVSQDNDPGKREATLKKTVTSKASPEELAEVKKPYLIYMTNKTPVPGEEERRESFVKVCLVRGTGYGVRYPYADTKVYGVDFVAQARPTGDATDLIRATRRVANTLHDYLGHNVVYDDYLTLTEFGAFWRERITAGAETPIVYIACHGFLWLVNPYNSSQYEESNSYWYEEVIRRASTKTKTVSALKVRMLFVSGCDSAVPDDSLLKWQAMLDAYGVYGVTTAKNCYFDLYVMHLYYRLHDCYEGGGGKETALSPNLDSIQLLVNSELRKAYAKKNDSVFYEIRKFDRLEREDPYGRDKPQIHGVIPDHSDERRFKLDWHVR
ncbi:MAG: hypothetical protein JW889_06370 [Verrucomicrobia bacterium]|nr:hypothetical protein [Verrucomicrobiota bacterium]